MSVASDDVAVYGYGLAFLAYGGFALYLHLSGRSISSDRRAGWPFMAALLATAAWAATCLLQRFWDESPSAALAQTADLARYGLWFFFLRALFSSADNTPAQGPWAALRARMYRVSGPGVIHSRKLATMKVQKFCVPSMCSLLATSAL
jgi:hypothetical protein